MAMRMFEREEILGRIAAQVEARRAVLAAASSCGLVAKCAVLGGADMLVVYSTGLSRLMGLPTSRIGDSNARTLELAAEIRNVVSSVPVIGGVEAWDPVRLDLDMLLDRFRAAGFSGVINYPTISTMGDKWRERRGHVGLGFDREVEMIALARQKNIFSLAYVASAEHAEAMARAGADCIVPHVGATRGGLVGHEAGQSLDEAVRRINEISAAAAAVRPDVVLLCHGGAVAEPEDTLEVYRLTNCVGFVGASSIERIPIERAVKTAVEAFKAVPLSRAI
ncbi:phosphoenolpyruvate hydrolase family protein [Bradyrhizobium sp. Arg314]